MYRAEKHSTMQTPCDPLSSFDITNVFVQRVLGQGQKQTRDSDRDNARLLTSLTMIHGQSLHVESSSTSPFRGWGFISTNEH